MIFIEMFRQLRLPFCLNSRKHKNKEGIEECKKPREL